MGRRRGFFTLIQQGIRESERAERRRQRDALARYRHLQRLQTAVAHAGARKAAEIETEAYHSQMGLLLSVHRACVPAIDWQTRSMVLAPVFDEPSHIQVDALRTPLDNYIPPWLIRVLRL